MLRYLVVLSKQEQALLETIQELRFGEVFGLEIQEEPEETCRVIEVSRSFADFIRAVRGGMTHISILSVHNGDPVLAELDYLDRGFRCRKKVRFPTEQSEG